MSKEAMQMALEALEEFGDHYDHCPQWPTWAQPELQPPCTCGYEDAITALRQALEKPADEPFGYFQYSMHMDAWIQNRNDNKGVAFYTRPQPARECSAYGSQWVGLTDEEIRQFWKEVTLKPCYTSELIQNFYLAIEAKLKEKNT